jgi:hypothetical protein
MKDIFLCLAKNCPPVSYDELNVGIYASNFFLNGLFDEWASSSLTYYLPKFSKNVMKRIIVVNVRNGITSSRLGSSEGFKLFFRRLYDGAHI